MHIYLQFSNLPRWQNCRIFCAIVDTIRIASNEKHCRNSLVFLYHPIFNVDNTSEQHPKRTIISHWLYNNNRYDSKPRQKSRQDIISKRLTFTSPAEGESESGTPIDWEQFTRIIQIHSNDNHRFVHTARSNLLTKPCNIYLCKKWTFWSFADLPLSRNTWIWLVQIGWHGWSLPLG